MKHFPLYRSTYLFIISLSCLLGTELSASQIPFSKFGYPETTVLYGPKASTTFYFKLMEGVDQDKNSIHLEIIPSQLILKDISTITFNIGEKPVLSSFLRQFGDTIKIDLPIQQDMIQEGYVKLEILSNLFLRDEDCRDYDEPGLWLNVSPNSYLEKAASELPKIQPKWMIDQFLPEINHLVLSKNFNINNPDLAAYLHYYFKKYQGKNLTVSNLEDSTTIAIDRAVILGTGAELSVLFPKAKNLSKKASEGELNIIYKKIPSTNSIDSVFTSNLILTGGDKEGMEKAIQFLLSREMAPSALSSEVSVYDAIEKESIFNTTLKKDYTFSNLGLETELSTGLGKIIKNIPLPNYLAQGRLKSLGLHLKISHKPIDESERGYMNIYLNNDLLGSYKLNESGILEKDVFTKNATFGTGSYIGIEYIYVPKGGLCDAQVSDFYAQINPRESFISPDFYPEAPLTFSSFPRNFSGAKMEIIHDYNFVNTDIPILSDLLMQINRRYESTTMDYLPSFSHLSDHPNALDSASNKILILKNPQNVMGYFTPSPYVEFSADSISYKSDEIDKFFDLKYQNQLAFMQLFQHAGNKVLMISSLSSEIEPLNMAMAGLDEPFLTNMGNVMIANSLRYYFFDLRNNELKSLSEENINQFEQFWTKFRLFFIITAVLLIIVLLSYIFIKSTEAKKKIEDARH